MTEQNGWVIVLIDDEKGIRKVTGLALRDAGYEVHTASEGLEGIQVCKDIKPQIVITDVKMPGLDGISVLENIKKSMPEIEVIVATAFGEMDTAIRALQLDASDFITKPINEEALSLALQRARERYTSKKRLKDYTRLLEDGWNEATAELMDMFTFQKNLIENSMDGIIGSNSENFVVIFNKIMEEILGYKKSQVLNRHTLWKFFSPEDETRFKEALAGDKYGGRNKLYLYQTTLLGCKGQSIPVQLSASMVLNKHNTKDGLVCFVRDLREIRKLEREMEDQAKILHQDKMMSLGRLAASVVHEINNPLAGVLNYCKLMLRILQRGELSGQNKQKFTDYLTLVESETGRCSKIVSNLLTFSRKSPASFTRVHVSDLLERSLLLSKHKLDLSNISVEIGDGENIPAVEGDFNQLQQCIINLIFNAIDAMPDGGNLRLHAETDRSRNEVVVSVSDSGVGIPEDKIQNIFEPFFTSKEEGYGVGLGLSTVYGIMEYHKGTVAVKSQVGKGSVFSLHFPIPSE